MTLLSFLASYLTPKASDFDEEKLKHADLEKPHENIIQDLNLVLWLLDHWKILQEDLQ